MDESADKQRTDGGKRDSSPFPADEEMFKTLFEEVPCYACILDTDLFIVAANRLCKENFATPFTRHCYQVFKGKTEACDDCAAQRTLREGCISEALQTVKHASGQEMEVVCRTLPIKNESGDVTGVLHMSSRTGHAEELQQAMTSLNSQIGAVSHGIKGLLTSMVGGFYLWDSGVAKDRADRIEKGVDIIRRNFHRIKHLAHDVLFFVKHRVMHAEPVKVSYLMNETLLSVEDIAGQMETEVVLGEMPDPEIMVAVDQRAIVSALSNLIVSSLHDCYTDKRDIPHSVHLSVERRKNEVVFKVSDNGVGMDEDNLKKLFSLFFNPKGIEAAGIGLFIANKLTRLHKGRVEVDSEQGKGTNYRLYLPAKE